MNERTLFVYRLATWLVARQLTITGPELAARANAAGLRTSYGTIYSGGRGTYTLIRCTYTSALREFGREAAEAVATAFVNSNGNYAYM